MEVEDRANREAAPGVNEAGETAVEVFLLGNRLRSLQTGECTTRLWAAFHSSASTQVWI